MVLSQIEKPSAKYCAEFLGTYMLVFCFGLIKVTMKLDQQGHAGVNDLAVFGPTAVGFVLMVLVYSLGSVSGGHFNPAVTCSIWIQKGIAVKEALTYMAVQSGAGVLAGVSAGWLYEFGTVGSLGPPDGSLFYGAPLVEFFYTCMLCFVVLNTTFAKKTKDNNYYGVAIGFTIIAGGYGGGFISGGAFNPAITLGMNFMGLSWNTLEVPIYLVAQLLGGIIASTFFILVRQEEKVEDDEQFRGYGPGKLAETIQQHFDPEDTSEFLGSFFFTLTVCLNKMVGHASAGGNPGGAFSNGAALMAMIFAVGDVSGGIFNPAVTLACLGRFFETGGGFGAEKLGDPKTSPKEGLKYVIWQLIGAGAAGGVSLLIWMAYGVANGIYPSPEIVPNAEASKLKAFFAEFFGTFFLAYTVLCVATVKKPLEGFAAFAVGGCVIGSGYAFGALSGGVLNPAVTVACGAFYKMSLIWTLSPILYLVAQLLGGVAAAAVFKFLTHTHEYDSNVKTEPLLG